MAGTKGKYVTFPVPYVLAERLESLLEESGKNDEWILKVFLEETDRHRNQER